MESAPRESVQKPTYSFVLHVGDYSFLHSCICSSIRPPIHPFLSTFNTYLPNTNNGAGKKWWINQNRRRGRAHRRNNTEIPSEIHAVQRISKDGDRE